MWVRRTAVLAVFLLASCGRGESAWTNGDATPLREASGPTHCGWEDARFLNYRGKTFVQDLDGSFPAGPSGGPSRTVAIEYTVVDAMPPDAEFTGFTEGDRELWVSPSSWPRAVFVLDDPEVQRWPRFLIGCK